MIRNEVLTVVGWILIGAAFIGFVVVQIMSSPGYQPSLTPLIGSGLISFLFVMNTRSKNPAVTKERPWLVIALALMFFVNIAGLYNRVSGQDPTKFSAVFPYVPIMGLALVLGAYAVYKRRK